MCAAETTLLLGASGQIGREIARQWRREDGRLLQASRQARPGWLRLDLCGQALPPCSYLLSAGPLDLLVQALARSDGPVPGLKRIVAFSSTSVLSKLKSPAAAERALATRLLRAESALVAWCGQWGVEWVLLRPTLVYGGHNRNINRAAQWLLRYGLLPYHWPGSGLRQPVHAAELAWLARRCLYHSQAPGRRWVAAGGETLTYAQMLQRVRQAVGRGMLLPVPGIGLWPLKWLQPEWHAMLLRQRQHLLFDDGDTRRVLGWSPGPFRPERQALLAG